MITCKNANLNRTDKDDTERVNFNVILNNMFAIYIDTYYSYRTLKIFFVFIRLK